MSHIPGIQGAQLPRQSLASSSNRSSAIMNPGPAKTQGLEAMQSQLHSPVASISGGTPHSIPESSKGAVMDKLDSQATTAAPKTQDTSLQGEVANMQANQSNVQAGPLKQANETPQPVMQGLKA